MINQIEGGTVEILQFDGLWVPVNELTGMFAHKSGHNTIIVSCVNIDNIEIQQALKSKEGVSKANVSLYETGDSYVQFLLEFETDVTDLELEYVNSVIDCILTNQ